MSYTNKAFAQTLCLIYHHLNTTLQTSQTSQQLRTTSSNTEQQLTRSKQA
jgi:hypothetical protein